MKTNTIALLPAILIAIAIQSGASIDNTNTNQGHPLVHTTAFTETTETTDPDYGPTYRVDPLNEHQRDYRLTYHQTLALERVAPHRREAMARIAFCESGFDADAVGDGGASLGAWQVQPRFWGSVPATLEEQAAQADRIAGVHGLHPWTTADGCDGWR